jgi:cholesterol transport system auxiliary component
MRSTLCAGIICACLSGCSTAGLGGGSAPATYQITAPDTRDLRLTRWPANLAVQMPTAARAIDTDRILVAKSGHISYFSGAAWSDRLPRLLRSCIAAAVQDAGAFRAVLSTQDRVDSDYALTVDIRNFQIEVGDGRTANAVVTLIARLSDDRTGKALATKDFSARVLVKSDDADTGVAALQKAFGEVAVQMVRWTSLQRGRKVAEN